MFPNYEILVFYQNRFNRWKKLSKLKHKDVIYCFTYMGNHYRGYTDKIINKINFKGEISVYQFREIEIKIPKNIL